MNIVLKFITAPVWKLATPCAFGPIRRMPRRRACATSACWRATPSVPVSPKPELITMALPMPRAAHWSITPATASWPTAMIATSGASGVAASEG